jgi:hypothetical protein
VADLPPLVIPVRIDDSNLLGSLRGAYAKMQAEVESRGLKVPISVEGSTTQGRAATFGSSGTSLSLAPTAGFSPVRPAVGGDPGFSAQRQAITDSLFGPAYQQLSAYQQRVSDYIASAPDPRGVRERIARGIFAQTSVMAEQGLNPASIFSSFIQTPEAFAQSEEARGGGMRERAFAHAYRQSQRQDQLDMRAMHARRTHALRNALNEPWGWGIDPSIIDEAAGMDERAGRRAGEREDADEAERQLRERKNRRGFFDRPSGRSALFLGSMALLETRNIVSAVGMMNNPMLNRTSLESMQTQERAIQQLQSGFAGAIVGGTLGMLDNGSLARGYSTSRLGSGFGVLGRYSPLAMQAAQIGAQEGIGEMESGSEAIQQRRDAARTTTQMRAETRIIEQRSSYRRRRMQAYERVEQIGEGLSSQAEALEEEVLDADAVGDRIRSSRANRRLGTLRKTTPDLIEAARRRADAEDSAINVGRDIARRSIIRQGRGLRQRMNLNFGRAEEVDFEAGLESEYDAADPELQNEIGYRQNLQRGERIFSGREGIRRREAQTNTTLLRARGKPYTAQIGELAESRKQALQNARYATLNVFGIDLSFDERPSINAEYDAKEKLLGAERARESRLLNLQLGGRAASLRQLLDPTMRGGNVIGAQAIDIATAGHVQAQQFRDIDRPIQAQQALQNSLLQEQVLGRSYTDSFRAVQFDTRENFINPRDQEDIGKVLQSIADEVRGLRDDLKVEQ